VHCRETAKDGQESAWAWVTPLAVNHATVQEVTQGGRERWREENEGFKAPKNGGMNLEHAYSHRCWAAYYYLLQIAHILLQLLEKGSLLRQLAQEHGKRTALAWFGSWQRMAVRLVDSLRYWQWPAEACDAAAARKMQIRLGSSCGPVAVGRVAGSGRFVCVSAGGWTRSPSRSFSFCLSHPATTPSSTKSGPPSLSAPDFSGLFCRPIICHPENMRYTPNG
jgi:hypothetical protein